MEHPKDPYHVRPFPQQPHRGGALSIELTELEKLLSDKTPDLEKLRTVQARIHDTANTYNDDKLIDMIRQMSKAIDVYKEKADPELIQPIIEQLLKIRIELKHL